MTNRKGEGLHSFLSDDAETDEGVRTGQRGDRRRRRYLEG